MPAAHSHVAPVPRPAPLSAERVLEHAGEHARLLRERASHAAATADAADTADADGGAAPGVWRTVDQPGARAGDGRAGSLRSGRTALARDAHPGQAGRLRRAVGAPIAVGVVLCVIAVLVAIVVALLRAGGAQVPEAAANVLPSAGGGEQTSADSGGVEENSVAAAVPAEGDTVIVHVAGAVRAPGIVELPAGSRVVDAVERAGGAADDAALGGVNLARLAVDGEQILVPDSTESGAVGPGPDAAGAGPAPAGVGTPAPGALSLSTATAAELETLPRVGPALAERIIEWRGEHGPFSSVDALTDVPGIGVKTLDGFRDRVSP